MIRHNVDFCKIEPRSMPLSIFHLNRSLMLMVQLKFSQLIKHLLYYFPQKICTGSLIIIDFIASVYEPFYNPSYIVTKFPRHVRFFVYVPTKIYRVVIKSISRYLLWSYDTYYRCVTLNDIRKEPLHRSRHIYHVSELYRK